MRIKLKDAFELQIGKTPSRNKSEYWNGVYKWVSISDIGNSEKYVYSTRELITDKGIIDSGVKVIPKGTVIMSFKLSIGKTAITTEDMYTNEAIVAFIDKKKIPIDIDYMYYLCSGSNWMQGVNKAVMGLTLNKATLSEKEINIPNIEIQKKCACNLDKIDRIIDLKKQQLDQLDLLVRSLFIEMFGDPVENPKKWDIIQLHDRCDIVTGNTPAREKSEYYGNYIEWIKSDNINTDDMYLTVAEEYLSKKGLLVGRCVEAGSILMTCIAGSIGCIGNVGVANRKVAFNQQINAIVPNKDSNIFIYWLMVLSKKYIQGTVNMSLKGILSKGKLSELYFPFPPIELQHKFEKNAIVIDKSKLAVKKSLEELEVLKKSLMQKYFA